MCCRDEISAGFASEVRLVSCDAPPLPLAQLAVPPPTALLQELVHHAAHARDAVVLHLHHARQERRGGGGRLVWWSAKGSRKGGFRNWSTMARWSARAEALPRPRPCREGEPLAAAAPEEGWGPAHARRPASPRPRSRPRGRAGGGCGGGGA